MSRKQSPKLAHQSSLKVCERKFQLWKTNWKLIGAAACFVMLTVTVYWPALWNNNIWDDESYVTSKPDAAGSAWLVPNLVSINRDAPILPLVHTSFWLEYHFW